MVPEVMSLLERGQRVAVVCDAGTPGISDPGERLVRAASAAGFAVLVVPGPSAAVAALVVSGLPTGRWCFEGFLPRKGATRASRLAAVAIEPRTVVLYEAPHRLVSTLRDLVEVCGGDRPVAVVRELTKMFEQTWRGTLASAAERAAGPDAVVPRGEYVIVVGGAMAVPPATDAEVIDRLAACVGRGKTRKEAVAEVTATLGLPKRRVYELSLTMPRPTPDTS